MPEIALTASTGRVTGSRSSSRLRKEGQIPGVIYGHGSEPVSIAVNARDLRSALSTDAGFNAVLEIDVDGTKLLTLTKSIQRDPVRNTVAHVDFQIVRRDEVMTVEVPIALVGEPVEVNRGGGVIDQQMHALSVQATPGNIPTHFEVDISGLAVGDSITVGQIRLPAGVATELDADIPVVVAQGAQAATAEDEADAAATDAAGEAAEGGAAEGGAAPGDAPAEG